jgi:glycogen operon protein
MTVEDWNDPRARILGMLIHGAASDEVDERGRPNRGQTLLLLLNASNRSRQFVLPDLPEGGGWQELVNTAHASTRAERAASVQILPHSLILLCLEATRPTDVPSA